MSICKHGIAGNDFCQTCWDDLREERDAAVVAVAELRSELADERTAAINISTHRRKEILAVHAALAISQKREATLHDLLIKLAEQGCACGDAGAPPCAHCRIVQLLETLEPPPEPIFEDAAASLLIDVTRKHVWHDWPVGVTGGLWRVNCPCGWFVDHQRPEDAEKVHRAHVLNEWRKQHATIGKG